MPGPADELIRWAARNGGPATDTDRDLLARFAAGRDGAAFAELVRRHGPAVFGVCRRVVGHRQDAEDAFQATFLVLARKSDRVGRPDALGGWLYGVAVRVARKARKAADRRRQRETPTDPLPESPAVADDRGSELAGVLDEELAALPAWYRDAVLLCDLRGKSRTEAAGELGIPEGTLSSRLNAGRKKLAVRLTRRGLGVPAAGLAALANDVTAVPPALAASAVEAAVAGSAGVAVPTNIQYLAAEGVWPVGKAKLLAGVVIAAGVGVGTVAGWQGEKPPEPAKEAKAEPAKAKAEPPKPVAEVKPDETPVKRSKPRLLRNFVTDGTAYRPVWSPNGDWIAADVHDGGPRVTEAVVFWTRDVAADGKQPRKIVVRGPRNHETGSQAVLGFLPDNMGDSCLVTMQHTGGRVNAENRLVFWALPHDVDGRTDIVGLYQPSRVLSYDDGEDVPFALMPDGKSALSTNPSGVRTLDLASGDTGRVVFNAADLGYATATADARRVASVAESKEGMTIRFWDLPTGKRLWEKAIQLPRGDRYYGYGRSVAISPDGRIVASISQHQPDVNTPQPDRFGWTARLFDGDTGAEKATLEGKIAGLSGLFNFSTDGKLLAGIVFEDKTLELQLVVWDAATGKVVKRWPGIGYAAFAPDRLVLTIVEKVNERVDGKQNPKSVLGLWDLSPLLK